MVGPLPVLHPYSRVGSLDWPTKVTTTLAGFITAASLHASAHAVNDGPSADTAAGVAQALRDLEVELIERG